MGSTFNKQGGGLTQQALMSSIPEDGSPEVRVLAPTKQALEQMEQDNLRPSSGRKGVKMVRKKGIKSVSQGTAFSSLTTSSFLMMAASPFKMGTGLIPKHKLVKEFINQQ